jgi:hypothetical protein
MNGKPTRRSFFGGASAALAAPFAATVAFGGEEDGARDVMGRLAALEDANAIRALQLRFARLVGGGRERAMATLFADPARASVDERLRSIVVNGDGTIEISSHGTAIARVPCLVTVATPIENCGTLVEMARLQGDGVVKRSEKRVLSSSLVKIDGAWKIERVEWLA